MIRVVTLAVIAPDSVCREFADRFERFTPKEFLRPPYGPYRGGTLGLRLLEGSPELQEAIQYAEERGLRYFLLSQVAFSLKETISAPFFYIRYMPYPFELEGIYPERYGTKYEGGCPCCGLGRHAVGDVLVDRKFMKKYEMGFLCPEIFVSERIKNLLEESDLTGFHFGNRIRDYKGRPMTEYYSLEIDSVLPPLSPTTWLKGEYLRECGHYRTLYLRSDPQYRAEDLENAKDFNRSCEYLDNFDMPQIILSAKAKNFLKEHKVYGRIWPLTIVP